MAVTPLLQLLHIARTAWSWKKETMQPGMQAVIMWLAWVFRTKLVHKLSHLFVDLQALLRMDNRNTHDQRIEAVDDIIQQVRLVNDVCVCV